MDKKTVGIVLVTLIGLTGGLVLWNGQQSAQSANPPGRGGKGADQGAVTVEATTITLGPAQTTLRAIGTVVAGEAITLRPEQDGRITRIAFESGAFVKKGEILLVIDQALLSAEVNAAAAAAEADATQFRRTEALFKNGTTTLRALEEARAQHNISKARLALAQTRLAQATIRAPFDGYVGLRQISPGDYVQKGDMLGTLDQLDPVRIHWMLAEKYLPLLHPGMKVQIETAGTQANTTTATISAISPRIDPATRLGQVEAKLPNPDQQIRPGQFVTVVITPEIRENALMIPEQALVSQGGQYFVWGLDADNKAQKIAVTPGMRIGTQIDIVSGLQPDQKIVTAGQQKLRPGQQTNPILPTPVIISPDDQEPGMMGDVK